MTSTADAGGNGKGWLPMVLGQYGSLQKFPIQPRNTLVSMEENKESRIDIDSEYSSGCFCLHLQFTGPSPSFGNRKGGHNLWSYYDLLDTSRDLTFAHTLAIKGSREYKAHVPYGSDLPGPYVTWCLAPITWDKNPIMHHSKPWTFSWGKLLTPSMWRVSTQQSTLL